MADTILEVFNAAIVGGIGEKAMATENDLGPRAAFLRQRWPEIAREALEKYPFNFAIRREKLARVTTGQEVVGFDYTYAKPGYCVRILDYSSDGSDDFPIDAQEESGKIVSNHDTVYIIFLHTENMLNVALWPQHFREYMAKALAVEIAPRTMDAQKLKDLQVSKLKAWSDSTVADAQQSPPKKKRRESNWNLARGGANQRRYQGW